MNELMTAQERAVALRSNTATTVASGEPTPLLRLLRDGVWVYGQDNVELDEGTRAVVNANTLAHGYISWADSKVEGEMMVSMLTTPLPTKESLPDAPGDGWDVQVGVMMYIPEDGVQVMYKGTSQGIRQAFGKLIDAIGEKMAAGGEAYHPTITLGVSHYQHKQYGKIYKPELAIVEWSDLSSDAAPAAEPSPLREAAEKAEAEQETVTRRRRRPAA